MNERFWSGAKHVGRAAPGATRTSIRTPLNPPTAAGQGPPTRSCSFARWISVTGPDPAIASLSLGATRIFVLKKKAEPGIRIPLVSGSLLVMNGRVQDDYRHGIPKTARPVGPRINLSFRRIVGT